MLVGNTADSSQNEYHLGFAQKIGMQSECLQFEQACASSLNFVRRRKSHGERFRKVRSY